MNAKFITLDGIDGSGKTTQLEVIKNWFEYNQLPVIFTREPGGTAIGESLRNMMLHTSENLSAKTETLLMFAARQQHLEEIIFPNLNQGIHVVCDRFTDATFAYQGGGRGLGGKAIEDLEIWVQGDFRPDLTIILDVPLAVSQERIERSREKDRFEQENADFYRIVRDAYLARAEQSPERYAVINSDREKPIVKQEIEEILNQLFGFASSAS